MSNLSVLGRLRVIVLSLTLVAAVACFPSSPPGSSSPPTVQPASRSTAPAVSTAIPSIYTPSSSAKILFAVPQTTEYSFSDQDPESKSADLLTSLGVPQDAQHVGIGAGGLPPAATLPALAGINDLAGAVYDAPTGRLLFVGKHNPALPDIDPADLVVALRAVNSGKEDPAVSIDPINPSDFGGPMKVSYYGETTNTHFGLVMFEADRYLKSLSTGRDNLTGKAITSTVPGYQSELDLMLKSSTGAQQQQWHRMWYLLKNKQLDLRVSADGQAMMFDQVPIMIEARFVVFDNQGQKHDVPGSDPAIDTFVSHFNSHFADFAVEKKEVGQLVQLAKMLSIARWLRDNKIPLDPTVLDEFLVEMQTPEKTQGQMVTKSQTETRANSIMTYTVSLFGGVDLDFDNKPRVPPPGDPVNQVGQVARNVPLVLQRDPVTVNVAGEDYQVAQLFVKRSEMTGNLMISPPVLSVPSGGRLPLEFALNYDSFSTESSPVGIGWSVESERLAFPPTKSIYQIEGRRVELYDNITVIDLVTGQRRGYHNSMKIIDGRVVYEIDEGQGLPLYYSYLDGNYSLQNEQIDSRFDDNGQLTALALGSERIDIRRDASGSPTVFEHSNGSAIRLRYEQGRLVEITGSNGAQARLTYDGSNLAKIERPGETSAIAYAQGRPAQIRDGASVVKYELDALGRVTSRQDNAWLGSTEYEADGSSVGELTGVNGREVTIESNQSGRITRVTATETARTADAQVVRQAMNPANLEQGSFLEMALDNPNVDLSWLTAGRSDQVIVEPAGKRTVRVEDRDLIVDGRLNVERVRTQWKVCQSSMDQLSQQGFAKLTADPESGVVAGFNPKTGETAAWVPSATGDPIRRSYPQLFGESQQMARLVTVLGAQSRGLPAVGFFQSPQNEFFLLNSNGEIQPFLSGAESILSDLRQAALIPGNRERTRQLADQLKEGLRRDIQDMFVSQWKVTSARNAEELVYEAYAPARELFKTGVPPEVASQIKEPVRAGEILHLQPIETPYGWLLPSPAPGTATFFLDAPTSLSYLISYDLSANRIRLVDSSSTPASVEDYLAREPLTPSQNFVVLFSPHSESPAEQVQAQRDLFQPVRARLEKLGVRVIDLGGDSSPREKLLTELANGEGNMVVLQVGHAETDGRLIIQGTEKIEVKPSDFQIVRGVDHFMSCCSLQNGLSEAAVRAGANSATGMVEPITLGEAFRELDMMADYMAQHPGGVLPSEMENALRLRILIERGGPGYEPLPLDLSLNGDARRRADA